MPRLMSWTNESRIYVAGHRGLVGSAIWRELERRGFGNLVGRSHSELDLCDTAATRNFFAGEKPEFVFLAAARVGGIHVNNELPVHFLEDNLRIQNNVISAAFKHGVKKLMFLGSSCIYPRLAPQPLKEDMLLTGPLEPTNECYAIAKIAGIKLCQAYRRQHGADFISAMPTNMYGPNDNYNLSTSHVLPALLRKFHEARESGAETVTCWGTGAPLREFLHADDCARACLHLMERYSDEPFVNIGAGDEVSIRELAETVRDVVGFKGKILWDKSQPDGTPRKLLDSSKLFEMGWRPEISLTEGIRRVYEDYRKSPETDDVVA